ncbi:MAG: Organic solvent tolerance protein [Verrucomicrobiales bacterium]|nr:Organic solvent tolerance protein [Verrucomicrobiales bacterium]
MNQLRALLFALTLIPTLLRAEEEPVGWDLQGRDIEFHFKTGDAIGTNGVTITKGDFFLTADKVNANERTGFVTAEGHVTIKNHNQVWSGERVGYNFKTHELSAVDLKTSHAPLLVSTMSLKGNTTNEVYEADDGFITTDDISEPAYRIRAKRLIIVPGRYIEAHDAIAYVRDVPVFYYPYYRRSLGRHLNNWVFAPGYRSIYGPYVQTTYNWYGNDRIDGAVHFDLRQRRGIAGGPDFHYHLGKQFGDGDFRYYFAHDERPGTDFSGNPNPANRQRIDFSHQASINSNLTAKAVIRYQSDPTIVRDFFEGEYRQNVQPNSFAEANQLWQNFSLDILAQPRINTFYETVERLPDVRLTGFRQQIFDTPLFYESETSAGYFRRKFADTNAATAALQDFSAGRGDTFHQVTLPQTYFGWLNVTPRVGGRFTYYSETTTTSVPMAEHRRAVFNTGAEVSFKASQIWTDAKSKVLETDGLRHIIEPSINYVYVPKPSIAPAQLPQFDYEIPSLRLLPIEFPDYNAIDSIDAFNVFRLGLRNKLQTKRESGVQDLINWALYTDWRLDRRIDYGSGTNRLTQSTFADVYSDLEFRPRSWITLGSETRYGVAQGYFREVNHRLTLLPNDVWSLTLGHRYLHEDPAFGIGPTGHNLIYDSIYYRFNENWAGHMSHYFEARDGVMEEQIYSLYRDLRSWTIALSFRVRGSHNGEPADYGPFISFSLKAAPHKLGSDTDKPWMLLGR